MIETVPVIDLTPFLEGSNVGKQRVAAEVATACESLGFLTIVGHGVPRELTDMTYDVTREFFDLPLEERMAVIQPAVDIFRGYHPIASLALSYSLDQKTPPDLKEGFVVGPIVTPDEEYFRRPEAVNFFYPNLWPKRPEGFRDTWTDYYQEMEALAATLMRIFAVALGLCEDYFDDKINKHISYLMASNYPKQPEDPLPGQLRAGAHTDYGSLTILYRDQAPGGLQILNQHNEWVDVKHVPESFVINIGDLMARWTNDRWVSTMHRVVNPPRNVALKSRRQSLVFFHQPNYDASINCLESCCDADNPPRYAPATTAEHLMMKALKMFDVDAEL